MADDVEVDEQPSSAMRALRAGNLVRATAIVSGALLLSRVLGLFRTTLFAATFGISIDADAFTNAFVFPEIIFNIVAGGALASAFIPVFTSYLIEKKDRRRPGISPAPRSISASPRSRSLPSLASSSRRRS